MLEERYAELGTKYQELSELYESRPARQEDLDLIGALRKEIKKKDDLLKKAIEDMKVYKLELENREFSYNKMFGTTPNVGVLDPRQNKSGIGGQGI
jgi:restriction endonuclease S subunit